MFTSTSTVNFPATGSPHSLKLVGRIERGSLVRAVLFVLLLAGASGAASGQTAACKKQCTSQGSDCYELRKENPKIYGRCVSQCEKKCETPPPPPITVKPKFLVLGPVYAPPGCTGSSSTGCSTSLVDYAAGSSLGSKVSISDSFKFGLKLSVDSFSPIGSAGGDAGFTITQTNSSSVAVTKSASRDIKASGNGDGIDHGQDMFILLLNPAVTLRQDATGNIFWSPGYNGPSAAIYEVFVSELRNPATMRPSTAQVVKSLAFTNDDYQTILNLDPFGGKVMVTGPHGGIVTTGGLAGATDGSGPALDGRRFRPTAWSLPYEPPLRSPDCNNGGICSCPAVTVNLKNDFVTDKSFTGVGEYTVGLQTNIGVPKVWDFKTDWTFTWTDSETDSSSTDASQSATATLSCPSVGYTGPTLVQVYWDSLFGTFLFIPYDLSANAVTQRGKVTTAAGKPAPGQLVELILNGKTYRTVTAADGSYRFGALPGQTITPQTGRIVVRNVEHAVALRSSEPTIIRMP
jgi:hypothetical protein